MPDLGRDGDLRSRFYSVWELRSFTIHWLYTLLLDYKLFLINPSWLAGKYIFRDAICHFCLILAFSKQKVGKTWTRNGHIWTHHTQIPLWMPISFHCLRKKSGTWKTLHSHSYGHVTWRFWVSLSAEFISLIVYCRLAFSARMLLSVVITYACVFFMSDKNINYANKCSENSEWTSIFWL